MTQKPVNNPLPAPPERHVHLFFLDGVGLGVADPDVNLFATAVLPHLSALFGQNWYLRGQDPITTGQAAILTGRNVPELVGEQYGPKPNTPATPSPPFSPAKTTPITPPPSVT